MVDHRVDLGDDRGLGIPARDMDVGRHLAVGVAIVADVDQRPVRQARDDVDDPLEQLGVAGTQTPEANVDQRLVGVLRDRRRGEAQLDLPGRGKAQALGGDLGVDHEQRVESPGRGEDGEVSLGGRGGAAPGGAQEQRQLQRDIKHG